MIKVFLQKHKKELLNHAKLLAYLSGIALFLVAICGGFGTLVSVTLARITLGCIIFGVYMVIYEISFGGGLQDNGGFS
jgi:cytochrome c oxidase assembly factor CtaG